tara:strand:+ start:26 stop:466 length:441 start_codon:yes stop_codon:yes gene_type:complete
MKNNKNHFESFLFKSLIESSNDFIITKENGYKFKVKSLKNEKKNLWSYNVNFKTGTIRRVIAYKCQLIYPSGYYRNLVNKFSYYCNVKNKITRNNMTYTNLNETYKKIYDNFEMFKRIVSVENLYNPKHEDFFVEEEKLKYGLSSI